jgi:hypothetical protein
MSKFVIYVHASAESEEGKLPTTEEWDEMGAFNKELENAGVLFFAEGLLSSSKAVRVYFSDSEPKIQNGPFQLENLVSGFWILNLNNIDEAIAWAKKIPFKKGSVEIRKIAGAEDFGPELADKFKAKEDDFAAKIGQL